MTAERLVILRKQLGVTQVQMAKLMGCSLVGYKRFEGGGRPIPDYIGQLAVAMTFCQRQGLWLPLMTALLES